MANQNVGVTITGKDLLSPVVKGVNRTMADFKKSAMDGFGIAAGLKFTDLAGDAFRFLATGAQEAVRAARDLQEQQTKSAAVFKESNAAVTAFARSASRGFGLSEQAALTATGTIGNLLTAVGQTPAEAAEMSLALVKLSADLASFNNRDIKEVITALQAGLVGEAEPARRLGINISMLRVENYLLAQGIVRTKSQITDSMKVWARYQIMLIDSKNAQGDFRRTSENLANQQRTLDANVENLRANLGAFLLGPATGFVDFLSMVVAKLGGNAGVNENIRLLIERIGGIQTQVEQLLPEGSGFKDFMEQARQLQIVFSEGDGNVTWLDEASVMLEKMDQHMIALALSSGVTSEEIRTLALYASDMGLSASSANFALRVLAEETSTVGNQLNFLTGAWTGLNAEQARFVGTAPTATDDMKSLSGAFRMFQTSSDFTQVKPKEYFKGLIDQVREFRQQVRWLEKHPRFMERVGQEYSRLISSPAFQKLKEQGGILATGLIGNIEQWGMEMFGTLDDASLDTFLIPLQDKIAQRLGYDTGKKAGQKLLMALSATIPGQFVIYNMGIREFPNRPFVEAPGGVPSREPSGTNTNPITDFEGEDDRRKGGSGGSGVMGGRARAFRSYLVGERGPEWLVMGSQGGQIVPNGGGGDIVVNVDGEALFRVMNKRMGRALAMGV